MTAVLGIAVAILALTIVGLALRMSGLKADAISADFARRDTETQLLASVSEFASYRRRTGKQLNDLRADIGSLEDDLDQCTAPGARRARLERLFQMTDELKS